MPSNKKSHKGEEKLYTKIKVIKQGVKKYKSFRFLWDITHPKYYNQKWRVAAWEEVINVWREHTQDVSPNYVKNRISRMRSSYTRQKKKVEYEWLNNGVRYKPRLWYYDLISFVGDPFKTSHKDDVDDVAFARALEEKQKKKSTIPVVKAASTPRSSVATKLQDKFCIKNGYILIQYQMVELLPQPFISMENFDYESALFVPEIEQESSPPFWGMTASDNDYNLSDEPLSSCCLINCEEDTEIPTSFLEFSLDKKEYVDIINGLNPNSFE